MFTGTNHVNSSINTSVTTDNEDQRSNWSPQQVNFDVVSILCYHTVLVSEYSIYHPYELNQQIIVMYHLVKEQTYNRYQLKKEVNKVHESDQHGNHGKTNYSQTENQQEVY